MRRWMVVYLDGATFSSDDGEAWEAPTLNVEVVYNEDPVVGFRVESSRHGYWGWRDDYGWVGFHTESGYWSYLFTVGAMKYVLYGDVLTDEAWAEIKAKAETLMEERKSAWRISERRSKDGP